MYYITHLISIISTHKLMFLPLSLSNHNPLITSPFPSRAPSFSSFKGFLLSNPLHTFYLIHQISRIYHQTIMFLPLSFIKVMTHIQVLFYLRHFLFHHSRVSYTALCSKQIAILHHLINRLQTN